MKLQLPDFLKKRIHKVIREKTKAKNYIIAALCAGFIISLLELACTGQVYFPTIIFMTSVPSLHFMAKFYLILYNLMFITPLVIIFLIVYYGISSLQLTDFMQRHTQSIKLLTSIFFFILASILILTI